MVAHVPDLASVWAWLGEVPDPEIPAISILDLGIVRDVTVSPDDRGAVVRVTVTPTYSGCPAIATIERDIASALAAHGIDRVVLDHRLSPAWTTDWLTESGREKMRAFGISPPQPRPAVAHAAIDLVGMTFEEAAACPRCGSAAVEVVSRYGSTPCKALYRCTACREPFDHFKTH